MLPVEVEHLQVTWNDLTNITRGRLFTADRFPQLEQDGISMPSSILSFPYYADRSNLGTTGDIHYTKLTKPVQIPWRPEIAWTFGQFQYRSGEPWEYCPRTFLQKQAKRLHEATGLNLHFGVELEFYLINKDGTPRDKSVYCEVASFDDPTIWNTFKEILNCFKILQIPLWVYHSEAGHGQFEIAIGPFNDVLKGADSVVIACQTIQRVAAKNNLLATFVPKPWPKMLGSSTHMHLSLVDDNGKSAMGTDTGERFTAGIYDHLPSTMMIFGPTYNSYARLVPGMWAGALHIVGTENKEAAIRLIRDFSTKKLSRIEIKPIDGTSSPYLAIGTLIGAGLDGILNKTPLPEETLEIDLEKCPTLPKSLKEAISAFELSKFTGELFGDKLKDILLVVRKDELEHWESAEDDPLKELLLRY